MPILPPGKEAGVTHVPDEYKGWPASSQPCRVTRAQMWCRPRSITWCERRSRLRTLAARIGLARSFGWGFRRGSLAGGSKEVLCSHLGEATPGLNLACSFGGPNRDPVAAVLYLPQRPENL